MNQFLLFTHHMLKTQEKTLIQKQIRYFYSKQEEKQISIKKFDQTERHYD